MGVMLSALKDMFGVKHKRCFFCGYRMPENAPQFKSIHDTVGFYVPYHETTCELMPTLRKYLSEPNEIYADSRKTASEDGGFGNK